MTETANRSLFALVGVALVLAFGAPNYAMADDDGVKVVDVDCTSSDTAEHDSINRALEEGKNRELVIEINGMCQERVRITRNDVTLIGTNPAEDGILGVVDGEALVEVWNADTSPSILVDETSVVLENLSISGDDITGLVNYDSGLTVTNCWITDHARTGFHISGSGYASVADSEFSRNGSFGVSVQRNGRLFCERCLFEDNGNFGVRAAAHGDAFLADSTISGQNGALAVQHGRLRAGNTDVTATGTALSLDNGGRMVWVNSSLSGSVLVLRLSHLRLFNVNQIFSPTPNPVHGNSFVEVDGGSVLGMDLSLFSTGSVTGASVGNLSCGVGTDIVCDGNETKTGSTCGLCP